MKKLLTVILLFTSLTVCAEQLSVSEALARYNVSSMAKGQSLSSADMQLAYTCKSSVDGDNCFYVFNRGSNGGYVILSADDNVKSLIGYTDSGTFDAANMSENLKSWLDGYTQQIDYAIKTNLKSELTSVKFEKNVGPLISSQWGQNIPYNLMTKNNYPSGCVATAMSQILYYWKDYVKSSYNYTFRWDLMKDTYDTTSVRVMNASDTAVAAIMSYAGKSVYMDYRRSGSNADVNVIPRALANDFGMDKSITLGFRFNYTNDGWLELLKGELDAGRPILYTATTSKYKVIGHAFICDGYDTSGLFHINWGWDGDSDGFYSIDLLNPIHQGTGGSISDNAYTDRHVIVYNIKKDEGGKPASDYSIEADIHSDIFKIKLGEKWDLSIYNVVNFGLTDVDAVLNYSIYDASYNLVSSQDCSELKMAAGGSTEVLKGYVDIPQTLKDGKYKIVCKYKVSDKYYDFICDSTTYNKGFDITVSDGYAYYGPVLNCTQLNVDRDTIKPHMPFKVTATIHNFCDTAVTQNVGLYLYNNFASYSPKNVSVTIQPGADYNLEIIDSLDEVTLANEGWWTGNFVLSLQAGYNYPLASKNVRYITNIDSLVFYKLNTISSRIIDSQEYNFNVEGIIYAIDMPFESYVYPVLLNKNKEVIYRMNGKYVSLEPGNLIDIKFRERVPYNLISDSFYISIYDSSKDCYMPNDTSGNLIYDLFTLKPNIYSNKFNPIYNSELWGSGNPFNILKEGEADIQSGAVAMSEVMYFWNYPRVGRGINSGTIYDWGRMKMKYDSNKTIYDRSDTAVARLMADADAAINAKSGSLAEKIAKSMVADFGYADSVRVISQSDMALAAFRDSIVLRVRNVFPVICTGEDADGNEHAFVCVGFKNKSLNLMFSDGIHALKAYSLDTIAYNKNLKAVVGVALSNNKTVGINEIKTSDNTSDGADGVYNISGQRVNAMDTQHGIYIVRNKKIGTKKIFR